MKVLISFAVLFGFHFSAFANQCTDFSGHYFAVGLESTSQELTISQTDCAEIKMEFKTVRANGSESTWTEQKILDGQEREVSKDYLVSYQFFGALLSESARIRRTDGSYAPAYGSWEFRDDGRLSRRWSDGSGLPIRAVYEKR